MFETVISLAQTQRQRSKLTKLQKSFKPSRKDDLATLLFLIYDFFIAENQKAYQACLKIMEDIGFPEGGSALQWPFIEPAYWLKYYLAESSEKNQIHKYLLDLNTQNRPEHMNQKWLNNILSDKSIQNAKFNYDDTDNTPLDKYEWGLSLLQEQLKQLTYKPLDDTTREAQIAEVEALVIELKEQFKKINKFIQGGKPINCK